MWIKEAAEIFKECQRDLSKPSGDNLHVERCRYCDEEMELKNVVVFGDDECFDMFEFYQYVFCDGKLYKAYFDIEDEEGNQIELDCLDYSKAYRIEDITSEVKEYL